jgi:hypothetical protein
MTRGSSPVSPARTTLWKSPMRVMRSWPIG